MTKFRPITDVNVKISAKDLHKAVAASNNDFIYCRDVKTGFMVVVCENKPADRPFMKWKEVVDG